MTVDNAHRRPGRGDTLTRSTREVMGMFATGITVVTAGGDGPHGMTANAFSSVSLDPPLVLVCVARTAVMHDAILGCGSYAVSVLGGEQEQVARYFADCRRPRGVAQFDGIGWRAGPYTGAPLLDGALAWLECELAEVYEGGDHSIFLGRVLDIGRVEDGRALLFFAGGYHRMVPVEPRAGESG
jgi:flavin reductase (DIM6/NTAB) family NADH-FMN oxidoreductase RutF